MSRGPRRQGCRNSCPATQVLHHHKFLHHHVSCASSFLRMTSLAVLAEVRRATTWAGQPPDPGGSAAHPDQLTPRSHDRNKVVSENSTNRKGGGWEKKHRGTKRASRYLIPRLGLGRPDQHPCMQTHGQAVRHSMLHKLAYSSASPGAALGRHMCQST